MAEISEGKGLLVGSLHYFSEVVKPPFLEVTKVILKELEPVTLTCSSNDTEITFSWFVNGQNLQFQEERMSYAKNNSILKINQTKMQDAGTYKCKVANLASFATSNGIYLDIFKPVKPPYMEFSNHIIKERKSVFLYCFSNDTRITFHWFFRGDPLKFQENRMMFSKNDSVLYIDPVLWEDSGKYQCKIANLVSSEGSNILQLYVLRELLSSLLTPYYFGGEHNFFINYVQN
ncbi:carcinoembryonic antigen-related cell adhesion molecule 1-like, partial [Sigmodon hispidus]